MTDVSRVMLEPAFVLHSRPYRNSSLIAELFTVNFGRMAVVARSARGPRSRYQGRLQLFSPLLVSWSGRSELKSLGDVEMSGANYFLRGKALLCAFYLNELLIRLLKHEDPSPMIYQHYQKLLERFSGSDVVETDLRYFEKSLLKELGYELSFNYDATTQSPILADHYYRYDLERGFVPLMTHGSDPLVFSGQFLRAFDEETLHNPDDCLAAKRLMRLILAKYLGDKPLQTRLLLTSFF